MEGWLPQDTALAGKTLELQPDPGPSCEGCLGFIYLGLVTSVCTSQYSGHWDGTESLILLCGNLVHRFTAPAAVSPKMGTSLWIRGGQAVTAVLCWYCCKRQVPLPSPLRARAARPPTNQPIQTSIAAACYVGYSSGSDQRAPQRKDKLKLLL